MNRLLGTSIVSVFLATGTAALAFECVRPEASFDKPDGFPERALTMVVLTTLALRWRLGQGGPEPGNPSALAFARQGPERGFQRCREPRGGGRVLSCRRLL